MYEFYSRSYDSVNATWNRQDEYRGRLNDPQSVLRYLYVNQSPVNLKDYYGFDWWSDWTNDLSSRVNDWSNDLQSRWNTMTQDVSRTWNDLTSGTTIERLWNLNQSVSKEHGLVSVFKGTLATGLKFISGVANLGVRLNIFMMSNESNLLSSLGINCGVLNENIKSAQDWLNDWNMRTGLAFEDLGVKPNRQEGRFICKFTEGICNSVQDLIGDEENLTGSQLVYDLENTLLEASFIKEAVNGVTKLFSGGDDVGKVLINSFDDSIKGELKYNTTTLQHMYSKHAGDFGVVSNWDLRSAGEFTKILQNQVSTVNPIQGTYRGTQEVLHYFNESTKLDIMTDLSGNLVGGWKLSDEQVKFLQSTGNIQ